MLDQICFLQTLILIRSARLDCPSLFRRTNARSKSRQTPSRHSRVAPGSTRTAYTLEPAAPHFLSDTRLLNRLLVSLSDLGELPVHGPLLLFGAVCASSFAPPSASLSVAGVQRTDEEVEWLVASGVGEELDRGAISETAQLLAGQYGQLAIESLHVFDFLMEQLNGFGNTDSGSSELMDHTDTAAAGFCSETHIGLVDFCAHVAVLDLLALLTRDVVLWSLDSQPPDVHHYPELFGPPNQTAFIQLVAKTLHVVVQHAQYASSQSQLTSNKNQESESGSGIGNRLASLIESLTEVFPQRLGILRLCSALMIPGRTASSRGAESCLVKLVSELISCMPFLSEPFSPDLLAMLSRNSTPWYPSLDGGGDLTQTNEVVLTQPYTIWQTESRFGDHRKSSCSTKLQLPAGTHGIIRSDLGLVIWKYEHSVWQVLEHEIQQTWSAFESVDKTEFELIGLPHSQSFSGSLDDHQTRLYTRLLRLFEFVCFVNSCVQADVHLPFCLRVMGRLWQLLTHILELASERQLETRRLPKDSEADNRFHRLLLNRLLPTMVCLWGAIMNNLANGGSTRLFENHADLWGHLFGDHATLFPRVLYARNVQSIKTQLNLTTSHITRQFAKMKTNLLDAGRPLNTVLSFELLIAYLDFVSGLLALTKWHSAAFADPSELSLLDNGMELLRGAVLFVVQHLLPDLLHPDKWIHFMSTSKNAFGLYCLAERCLILLTDLLTTSCLDSDSLENLDLQSSDAVHEALQSTGKIHPIGKLRQFALHLLLNNRWALDSLLALSSIPLRLLLVRHKTLENGLNVTTANGQSNACLNSHGGRMARTTWLAIILVHHLLNLEYAWYTRHSGSSFSTPVQPLLSEIRRRVNPSTREHYVATLFQYIYYPYNVGLSRAAVTLLKWIVQYSDMNVVESLGDQTSFVRSICFQRLASSTDDQLTRACLFDLIAESVLCCDEFQDNNGQSSTRRPTGFLRLLISSPPISRGALEDHWLGTMPPDTAEKEQQKQDLFKCCLAVLKDARDKSKEASVDQITSLCLRNVCKLISAFYLQDLQSCIDTMKNEPNFWELVTFPLMNFLRTARNNEKVDLSNVENELFGHIVSILALELFNTIFQQFSSTLDQSLDKILSQLVRQNAYTSWFKLVAHRLQQHSRTVPINTRLSPESQTTQQQSTQLDALYDATCRWKCLLVLHLKLIQAGFERPTISLSESSLNVSPLVTELLTCLHLLNDIAFESGTSALAGQLGACLTTALQHQTQCLLRQPKTLPMDLEDRLGQVLYLVLQFRPDPDEQTQHMHVELLASCSLLLQMTKDETAVTDKQNSKGDFQRLRLDLLHCVFAYMAPLSLCMKLTVADEQALRQCINLVMQLWTIVGPDLVSDRLVQTGILHNLLQTMVQYSKMRNGASLCRDILSLVSMLALPCAVQNPCMNRRLYPDLDESQILLNGKKGMNGRSAQVLFSGAELVASYGPLLSQALIWPGTEVLIQWIREDEATFAISRTSLPVNSDISPLSISPGAVSGSIPPKGEWTALLLTQLRFLCSLYDALGGLAHPFVGQLLHTFCSENSSQFEALLTLWSESLYNSALLTPTLQRPLPPTASLLREGLLSPSRIQLAESLCALLWRVLLSGQSLGISPVTSGSGLPTLGMNVLFRSDSRANENLSTDAIRCAASYGPASSPQFAAAVFSMAEFQIHVCTVLFERPGFRPGAKTLVGGTPNHTPSKSTQVPDARSRSMASPSRPLTPLRKAGLESPLFPATDASAMMTGSDSTGEAELECLVRHLVTSLSLLIIQLPSLGYLSLLSCEELHELRSPIQLVFNSPSLDDSSFRVSFGGLLNLAHSLGYLISKVCGQTRLAEVPGANRDKNRLRSLLVQAHEMTVSLICSQATLVLASAQTSPSDKQLLLRELAGELKSSNVFGRPTRRVHRSSIARSSRSPRSRSSSVVHQRPHDSSPHTSTSVSVVGAAVAESAQDSMGTKLCTSDLTAFDFEQAVDRFAELLRLTV
ncbi:nuclear pore complex protein Nup188 [Clonorchis sinensis]|uniref:Nuclear pore complex protein Nup188 n=1 Tax=Clonorchis sinensis TaxID=79923 RepID=G7Y4W2_CLOSI|nr:nuclear pore complex protein Nup188 [Clonorchis sinensis]